MDPDPTSPFFARPWAVRLGFALLAGFTVIVGLTFFDHTRRIQLETTTETTAVGDTAYFKLTDRTKLPAVAASLNGQPLYVMTQETVEVRDTHTLRVPGQSAPHLTVYQLSAAATAEERDRAETGRKSYLLKTAPNQYLRAQPVAP